MTRFEELQEIFKDAGEAEQKLIIPLLHEVEFLESRMSELKKMPFISIHPRKPALQKTTAAARQYKECSQSYMNAIRILAGILRKTDTSAADELMKKLEEFM